MACAFQYDSAFCTIFLLYLKILAHTYNTCTYQQIPYLKIPTIQAHPSKAWIFFETEPWSYMLERKAAKALVHINCDIHAHTYEYIHIPAIPTHTYIDELRKNHETLTWALYFVNFARIDTTCTCLHIHAHTCNTYTYLQHMQMHTHTCRYIHKPALLQLSGFHFWCTRTPKI